MIFSNLIRSAIRRILKSDFFLRLSINSFSEHLLLQEISQNKRLLENFGRFAAQGRLNALIIPYRAQMIWPYWVYKQFLPNSASFIPRNFCLPSINATYRSWTSLSAPGTNETAIIDPRGLITPLRFGWSLDIWLANSESIFSPAQLKNVTQTLDPDTLILNTHIELNQIHILSEVFFCPDKINENLLLNQVTLTNRSNNLINFSFFFSIRPYNPEGISAISDITYLSANAFIINNRLGVIFDQKPDNIICLNDEDGDISQLYNQYEMILQSRCKNRLASAFVEYRLSLNPGQSRTFSCRIPTDENEALLNPFIKILPQLAIQQLINRIKMNRKSHYTDLKNKLIEDTKEKIKIFSQFTIPDKKLEKLINQNRLQLLNFVGKRTIFSGGFTAKEFKIKEAVHILMALNRFGYVTLSERIIKQLLRPDLLNYFSRPLSRKNDHFGQLLFLILDCYGFNQDLHFLKDRLSSVHYLVRLIERRLVKYNMKTPYTVGLLKKGYSTEELGSKDYFFYDNFWALAGIRSAIQIYDACNTTDRLQKCKTLERIISRSISKAVDHLFEKSKESKYFPVSVQKKIDSRIIENLVSVYPLHLFQPDNLLISNTIKIIEKKYLVNGIFFSDSSSSGFSTANNSLMAQILLLRRDPHAIDILHWMQKTASPTGCWPELLHPITAHGTFGDGHSGYATAHFLNLIRNMLCTEIGETLHLLPMIPPDWMKTDNALTLKEFPTHFGKLNLEVLFKEDKAQVALSHQFKKAPKEIKMTFPQRILKFNVDGQDRIINSNTAIIPASATKITFYFQLVTHAV